jgi:soluble P-type ATPase
MPKISFDYDGTLSTKRGFNLAQKLKSEGADLYIISARNDKQGMLRVAKELGIPTDKVFATGSNKAKIEKVKELNITKHYDNNPDVIKELDKIGKLI